MKQKLASRRELIPILVFITISTLVGLFILADYGESRDEALNRRYGEHSIENYRRLLRGQAPVEFVEGHLDYKGPAFFIGSALLSDLFQVLVPGMPEIESWHLVYFLTFELSVFFMYLLARRFIGVWAAFGAAALYGGQPLLWGHAFINPKDTPFMAFFLISVVLGLMLVDQADAIGILRTKPDQHLTGVRGRWASLQPGRRRRIATDWIVVIGLGVLNVVLAGVFRSAVSNGVAAVYHAQPDSLWGSLFSRFALHASQVPVDAYIHKAQILFQRFYWGLWGFLLFITSLWTFRNVTNALTWRRAEVLRYLGAVIKSPIYVLAGLGLGLTVSIRILGPYVFVLVTAYAILILQERALLVLTPYFLIAALTTYLTWPFLWVDPISRLFASLSTMSSYPWQGDLLFSGQLYHSTDLPWFYIPKLLPLQLTEPVVIAFLPGLLLSIQRFVQTKRIDLPAILIFWFVIPTAVIVVVSDNLYDNFRHILFVLPPLFLACGIVLDWLFQKVKSAHWRMAVLGVILFPSLYGLVALHPYQYVYFNSFTGGNEGAFRSYEMDYWLVSFREIGLYLNQHAEPGTRVLVFGPSYLIQNVLREDILVFESQPDPPPDYAVVPARKNDDLLGCRDAPVIYRVERAGAILGVVKEPEIAEQCP